MEINSTLPLREVQQTFNKEWKTIERKVLEDGEVVKNESWYYDEQGRVVYYDAGDGRAYKTEYTPLEDGSTETTVVHTLNGETVNVYSRVADKHTTFATDDIPLGYRATYDESGQLTYKFGD